MRVDEQSHTDVRGATVGGSPEGGPPTDLFGRGEQTKEVGT
jgi:hypothetical protein